VTIESGSTAAEAGVAFFNSSGRIADSVVGPITAADGGGWGVVETNSLLAEGAGVPERQVTITDSTVKGYGAGGVLFDGSKGEAGPTARSGMNQVGYVLGSTIEGSGGSSAVPQIGVAYRSGAHGEVAGSAVVANHGATGPSYGILAADSGPLSVEGSEIAGNGGPGYGLYNADADATGVSTGEPVIATGDFWGDGGSPVAGETVLGPPDAEGVEGPVTTTSPLGAAPTVPAVPALLPDSPPVGEIVDPAGGEAVEAGVAMEPVVFAEDDYGVKSVSLEADGTPVGPAIGEAPYAFSWTPTEAELGGNVVLKATVTDSSGQVTTSEVTVPVVKGVKTVTERELAEEKEAKEEAEEAAAEELAATEAEAAEALAAAETQLKEAMANAEAAAKAAAESSSAAAKAAEEKADAELKAAEAKLATAERELKEAEQATKVSFGKVTPNTKTGTARLGVVVPAPGALTVGGPGIKKVSGHPTGPGEVQVLIAAKGAALKTLEKKGKVTVKVTVKLAAPSGTKSATTTVTLMKK
jgi:Bacterial Ig domain